MTKRMIGVIGGSGVYELEALQNAQWQDVDTPWGRPSDQVLTGELNRLKLAFLPRHGRGHVHAPGDVPYRANIDALKRLGVTDVIGISACGSFREAMAPGDFVMVDQFIDRTKSRDASFFGSGCVAHVSLAHPTCPHLSQLCAQAARAAGITVHEGGTYLAMEGPQFSTLAESHLYRDVWGCDVIGMTNMPEARLAREAELCYAPIAMVTDYDSWHPDHGAVDITRILEVAGRNAQNARTLLSNLPAEIATRATPCAAGCDRALDFAIITAPDKRDADYMRRLDAIAGRVL